MTPSFPPLLHGVACAEDPLAVAIKMARQGCDGGTVVYNLTGPDLQAAIIFAPEVPLSKAMAMLPACGTGFQNALGAIAPAEVAVHLDWDGPIRVNGGLCGGLCVRAATHDPAAVPDWLIIGLQVPFLPPSVTPGETPDQTALYAEGCGDVDATELLEGWARHSLLWVTRWLDDGPAPVHAEWRGLLHGIGTGDFIGIDEDFGMLRKSGDQTTLIPLTSILDMR